MSDIKKILFVDDEKRILETYSLTLRDLGYHVKTASRPEDALSILSKESFDMVFVDQYLGKMKGLDLIEKMSGIDTELQFVMITGNGNTSLAVKSFKKGASDFLSKPFLTADLIRSIEYVNKRRQLEAQRKELLKSLEFKVNEKTEELKGIYFSVLSSLAQAMEKKDIGTYGHCRRVSYCSRLIAAVLGFSDEGREDLKAIAMLHDIGKIGISDFILGKKGPLTDEEFQIIRSHPQNGVEILKPLKQFESILPAILHHHENYDGSGYPHGLAGEDIPLNARIIAVADTYDAIISSRPYRSGASHDCAIDELVSCSGGQFDPQIVKAFVEVDKKYRKITVAK
jgi:putative nucleotidyltransferase with HDIG domain